MREKTLFPNLIFNIHVLNGSDNRENYNHNSMEL